MNICTRHWHYVLITFFALNLLHFNQSQNPQKPVNVYCQWSYVQVTGNPDSTCSDGLFDYVFDPSACKPNSQMPKGVNCTSVDPASPPTCNSYSLIRDTPKTIHYQCAERFGEGGTAVNNIYDCLGVTDGYRCIGIPKRPPVKNKVCGEGKDGKPICLT